MKDVKEIHHIPNIEEYMNLEFSFQGYDVSDNTMFYSYDLGGETYLNLDIISDEKFIQPLEFLHDLLYSSNVGYLSFQIRLNESDELLKSWEYRPLVKESEKNY